MSYKEHLERIEEIGDMNTSELRNFLEENKQSYERSSSRYQLLMQTIKYYGEQILQKLPEQNILNKDSREKYLYGLLDVDYDFEQPIFRYIFAEFLLYSFPTECLDDLISKARQVINHLTISFTSNEKYHITLHLLGSIIFNIKKTSQLS